MKKVLIAVVILGMSGGAYAADFEKLAVKAGGLKALASAEGVAVPDVPKGDMRSAEAGTPVKFITINGGSFMMGRESMGSLFGDAKPIHAVAIKTFEMSKTEVTVGQYAQCVEQGACTEPTTGKYCNWGKPNRQLYPANCVTWDQANQYAKFIGARLPSEAEWEYAVKSGGKNQKYSWGNDKPTCDKAVMHGRGDDGCGTGGTLPVCSKPAGNTAQGLCDMIGNVGEWVQDKYQFSYDEAPADGSAYEASGSMRVMRGGSFVSGELSYLNLGDLRADSRSNSPADLRYPYYGFRLAR